MSYLLCEDREMAVNVILISDEMVSWIIGIVYSDQ